VKWQVGNVKVVTRWQVRGNPNPGERQVQAERCAEAKAGVQCAWCGAEGSRQAGGKGAVVQQAVCSACAVRAVAAECGTGKPGPGEDGEVVVQVCVCSSANAVSTMQVPAPQNALW